MNSNTKQLSLYETLFILSGAIVAIVLHEFFDAPSWLIVCFAMTAALVGVLIENKVKAIRLTKAPQNQPKYISPYAVSFDDLNITAFHLDGVVQTLAWADVLLIYIKIDDSFLPEPWWQLFGGGQLCSFPSSANGQAELVNEFETRLAGYHSKASYMAIITAMGAMSGSFEIWSRQSEK